MVNLIEFKVEKLIDVHDTLELGLGALQNQLGDDDSDIPELLERISRFQELKALVWELVLFNKWKEILEERIQRKLGGLTGNLDDVSFWATLSDRRFPWGGYRKPGDDKAL